MKKNLSIILVVLIFLSCSTRKQKAVKSEAIFLLKRPLIKEVIQLESDINATKINNNFSIGLSEEYFPEINKYFFAQPLVFSRRQLGLNTSISYFFTQKDSIIRLIEYSWDDLSMGDSIALLFKNNNEQLTRYFKGKAIRKEQRFDWGWQTNLSWENDSVYVFQFMYGNSKPERTRVVVRFK